MGPLAQSVYRASVHPSHTRARRDFDLLRRRPPPAISSAQFSPNTPKNTHGYAGFPNGFAALGCTPSTSKPVCVYESPLLPVSAIHPPPTRRRRAKSCIRTRQTYAAQPSTTTTHTRAQQGQAQGQAQAQAPQPPRPRAQAPPCTKRIQPFRASGEKTQRETRIASENGETDGMDESNLPLCARSVTIYRSSLTRSPTHTHMQSQVGRQVCM